jgi:hypothetical protein
MEKARPRPLPLKEEEKAGDTLSEAALEAAKYAGPTRVKYNLPGRYARDLVIPIYKCENAGVVVLNIIVNQEGRVVSATVDSGRSAPGSCMHETALRAARRSLFNADPAPRRNSREPSPFTSCHRGNPYGRNTKGWPPSAMFRIIL